MSEKDVEESSSSSNSSNETSSKNKKKNKKIFKIKKKIILKNALQIDLIILLKKKYILIAQTSNATLCNLKGKVKKEFSHPGCILSACEYNDKYFITAADGLILWKYNGKEKRKISNINSYDCVIKYNKLIVASDKTSVYFFDIKGKLIKTVDTGINLMYRMLQTKKNEILIGGDQGNFGVIKDYKYKTLTQIGNNTYVSDFQLISKNEILYIIDNSVIGILNFKTKKNKILNINDLSYLLAVSDKYIIFTIKNNNKIIVTNKKGKLLQTIDNPTCFGKL
jgi:hypothetical protein